ncbi:hypothetical protein K2173_002112 [Erythroxylum novogranatense]|uniref:Scarecrow-like protein 9 n=1 Tax=Erythroxylum novogranatense TaxID=1862640 RepID=A0AAV8SPK5_9ROSI|nr:hypothetical protein K2173_002112 [Erythroxylum novogranatense]
MDPRFRGYSSSMNGIQFRSQPLSVLPNKNLVSGNRFENSFVDRSFREFQCSPPDAGPSNATPYSNVTQEEDSPEDCDFSDTVLKYISEMLMEEDMEDQTCMLQDSLGLQAAEKSFYEVLGKKYPPSPEPNQAFSNQTGETVCDSFSSNCSPSVSSKISDGYLDDSLWIVNPKHKDLLQSRTFRAPSVVSQSSYSSSNSLATSGDGLVDSPSSTCKISDWSGENQSILQFRKGVEEASKFLPSVDGLFLKAGSNGVFSEKSKGRLSEVAIKLEKRDDRDMLPRESRGRKNPHRGDEDTKEERSSKQQATYAESDLRSDAYDRMLLYSAGEGKSDLTALCETFKNAGLKNDQNGQSKGSNGGKGSGKKRGVKKKVVDLRTLMISCAQAVAADDSRSASELLKEIRQHSFPFGDGNQRLAHCFANGLEARLAGTGSQIYKGLVSKRTTAADILKAYHLVLAACPFRKLTNFVSNRTIMNISENSAKVHVIDFGVYYGFQWPTLIQRLSWRSGGPPKLRITGIDFPQPGFRPAERVEETGRRLADYAKKFNVPFQYNAIAKKWETIQLEELKIDKDEIVVVTCFYRAKNLLDETVSVDSPRNMVLNFIRKINPTIFIHGIVNGAYNAPFFVTRFREALFHFSALFDMLETIVPRENPQRMLIEKEIFGREAMNVIACEGWERVERPETYKQWQVRCLRAGFVQEPFDRELLKVAYDKLRHLYHREFLIDEDGQWLLQGWKGRIIYTLSAWRPTQKA